MKFFPDEASNFALHVDLLFLGLLAVSAFFVVVVAAPILYYSIRYRRGSRADRSNPSSGSLRVEMAWTLGTAVLALGLFAWGAVVYAHIETAPAGLEPVHVIAKQWMWKLEHAEGKREINELHVPLGHPVRLLMTSQDVIHSFYVPAFRVKQDVVPGRYTSIWFKPSKPGTYHLFCAEYCGTNHSAMIGTVTVMEPADYTDWLQRGEVGDSIIAEGRQLYHDLGCSGCHGHSQAVRAPGLAGLFGRPVPMATGGTVIANEQYIHDSILLPGSQVVAGYENLMPTFSGQVNESQVMKLVAYIKSLGGQPPGAVEENTP
jgi:cytochrome c oxidase subunit 2